MTDLLIFLTAFAVFIGVWWFVAKRMKAMGRGGIVRHLLGGMLGLFSWLVVLGGLVGATGQPEQTTSSEQSEEKVVDDGFDAVVADEVSPAGPEHFASVLEMAERMNDYPPELDQFELRSKDPLHIRISPAVFDFNDDEVIYYDNWRSAVYGVYNTFIHTDAGHVTVDAIPQKFVSLQDRENPEMLTDYTVTVDVSREEALSVVQTLIDVETLSDLKEDKGEYYGWTEDFQSLYYKDQSPGLDAFIDKLSAFCSNECPTTRPVVDQWAEQRAEVEAGPDIGITPAQYAERFNTHMSELGQSFRIQADYEPSGMAQDTFNTTVTPNIALVGTAKSSGAMNGVTVIAQGDGTPESGAAMILVASVGLASVQDSKSVDQVMNDIVMELVAEASQNGEAAREADGIRYSLSLSDMIGAMFTAGPAS